MSLSEGYIDRHITRNEPVMLRRMSRYPPQQIVPAHSKGKHGRAGNNISCQWCVGRHSDCGLLTMVSADATGSECQHPIHEARHLAPLKPKNYECWRHFGCLSAGMFVSPYHRGKNQCKSHARLSLPFV